MSEVHFDVNIANGVVIDVAIDVLPVWWMEVYPFRVIQSEALLHAEIKWFPDEVLCWTKLKFIVFINSRADNSFTLIELLIKNSNSFKIVLV